MTANDLRWLAEAADGERDKPMAIVVEDGRLRVVERKDSAGAVVVEVETPLGGEKGIAGTHKKVSVLIDGVGYELVDEDGGVADAVFLSQSAVEKFVLPYYLRFKTPASVQALKAQLFQADNVCAYHVPPSVTYPVLMGNLRLRKRGGGSEQLREV